jgi:hypothetical protein
VSKDVEAKKKTLFEAQKAEIDNAYFETLKKVHGELQNLAINRAKGVLKVHDDFIEALEQAEIEGIIKAVNEELKKPNSQIIGLNDLPFKVRYEIGQVLLKDNPGRAKELSEWVAKGKEKQGYV